MDVTTSTASILLVDDNPANLFVLKAVLSDLSEDLVEAQSGSEALQCVRENDFAVILLDVLMPGLSGFETARLIRAEHRSRHTPIIFLTANDTDRAFLEEGYALGAVDFLVKPYYPFALRAKVREFIKIFAERQEIRREREQLRLLLHGTKDEQSRAVRQQWDRLCRSEQELADFFESAAIGLCWIGPDGTLLRANRAILEIIGYGTEECIGRPIADFMTDENTMGEFLQCLRSGETLKEFPAQLHCKDGSIKDVLIDANVLWREEQFIHARCFLRDITDHKRVEDALLESERRFSRFMQHLPGLAWIKDADGRYVYANDAAEQAFQTPRADLYGKSDEEIFCPATASAFRENDRKALSSQTGIQVVEALEHEDGLVHYSLVSKFPIPGSNGQVALIGGMAVDITEHKRVEQALRDADRRKDEFLATLAHELRNPLAPIRNSIQILKLEGVDEETTQHAREVIDRQVQHLVRLVDDLLDVSRVMRGKVDLRKERVDLGTVVARGVEIAKALIESQGHQLDIDLSSEPLRLNADPIRMAQVVGNLLTNAAKYTEAGGHIGITAQREDDEIVMCVSDDGIGIAPDVLPHVFDLFVQADNASTKAHGGLGIGLTLVRNLVELHGGRIDAYSEGLGKGSEFVVRLPLLREADKEHGGPEGTTSRNAGSSGQRILVVDDNQDSAMSLAMLLRLQGFKVELANGGQAAIQIAPSFLPDLVFLDIGMPAMDGYEVARHMRSIPALETTLLVALTGWGQPEDRERTAKAGFHHHLVKPLEPTALTAILALLSQKR
jgi:PAS domain S-box-containing protein